MSSSRHAPVIDEALGAMFNAFAGHPVPSLQREGLRKRSATRRSAIVLVVAAALVGIAVPGAVALVRAFWQSPQQFIADHSEPANARTAIEHYIARSSGAFPLPPLTGIERVVTAATPDGEYRVYALHFKGAGEGIAVISSAAGGVASMSRGPATRCPGAWAFQAGVSFVAYPGKTPVYVTGRASAAVKSVEVDQQDRHATSGVVANGYFLAWITPSRGIARGGTVVARDRAGKKIGELHVTRGGTIPRLRGASTRGPSCG
jgi:hypothetical protein